MIKKPELLRNNSAKRYTPNRLERIENRLARIESRLVQFMLYAGANPYEENREGELLDILQGENEQKKEENE